MKNVSSVLNISEIVSGGNYVDTIPELIVSLRSCDRKDVRRIGTALTQLGLDSSTLREVLPGGARAVSVRISGTSTTENLKASLVGELLRIGISPSVSCAPYGSYLEELFNNDNYENRADIDYFVLLIDVIHLFEGLQPGWSIADLEEQLHDFANTLKSAISRYHKGSDARIIMNTPQFPHDYYLRILSYEDRLRASLVWHQFVLDVLDIAIDDTKVTIIDFDATALQFGKAVDPALSRYARIHYDEETLATFVAEVAKVIAAAEGLTQKVLVLDLDDTLWGGTLAEEGVQGLEEGSTPKAEAFKAFQSCVQHLARQGVVLVICSKNDADEVQKAFSTYSGFTIDRKDITVVDTGWEPKPERIRRIADRLKLNTDSFVFIDDNEAELGATTDLLTGVLPIKANPQDPALNSSALLDASWFCSLVSTSEDASRVDMYKTEYARTEAAEAAGSYEEYLQSLDTCVKIHPVHPDELPRVSQLTLRTNQWNTTTIRLDLVNLKEYLKLSNREVFTVYCEDRFGDHGLIAALFLHIDHNNNMIVIEDYVMSCRVMGRGIEHFVLNEIVQHVAKQSVTKIFVHFRPSPKNEKARQFFLDSGFKLADKTVPSIFLNGLDGIASDEIFVIQVNQFKPHLFIEFINAIETLEG